MSAAAPGAIIIPADSAQPIRPREPVQPGEPETIVGGRIEHVDLYEIDATLFVNESGIPRGRPGCGGCGTREHDTARSSPATSS